ncbi:hypothetical protein LIER_34745 [Lithospermum erythrorhizon]|uniref:Uncharacterized protein n=1 Tax=Lithospermum erythrorhizon TaxID=34254 RepID=A0AAV3S3P9_LITER
MPHGIHVSGSAVWLSPSTPRGIHLGRPDFSWAPGLHVSSGLNVCGLAFGPSGVLGSRDPFGMDCWLVGYIDQWLATPFGLSNSLLSR